MQKTLKKFIVLISLLFAIILCVGLVACGDDNNHSGSSGSENNTVTYSITVTCDDTGLDLTTLKAKWVGSENSSDEIAIGNDGKASVDLDAGNYTVSLIGVPNGYSWSPASVTKDNTAASIAISKHSDENTKTITVSFDLPNGFAFASDVSLQVSVDDVIYGLVPLNGSADLTVDIPEDGDYSIALIDASLKLNGELVPDYCDFAISYDKANDAVTVSVSYKSYTYTVNVAASDASILDGVTVSIYSGTDVVASNLPIVDGAASALLPAGNYSAVLVGLDSDYFYDTPAALTYADHSTSVSVKSRVLNAPVISIDDGVISWSPVANASGYIVYEDGEEGPHLGIDYTSYTIDTSNLSYGTHSYYVIAKGSNPYLNSPASNTETYDFEEPSAYDLTVGVASTFDVPAGWTNPVEKTIYLEIGTYSVNVIGGNDSVFVVIIDVETYGTQYLIESAGVYTVKCTNFTSDTVTLTVTVVCDSTSLPEIPTEHRLTLDQAEEIVLTAYAEIDYKFTSDMAGIYEIVLSDISGEDYTVKVDNGEPIIDGSFGVTSATFAASLETEYTITFYADSNKIFTATVSYKRPSDIALSPANDESSAAEVWGVIAGKNEAIDLDENAEDLETVGKLVFSGLKANYKYTMIVYAQGQFSDYKLVYNGEQFDSYNYEYTDYRIDFVAVAGEDGSVISEASLYVINSNEDNKACSIRLFEVEEVGDDVVFGLIKTITLELNVSSWEATGTIAELNDLVAGGYKLVVTADTNSFFNGWEGITISYGTSGNQFKAVGNEASYTVTGSNSFTYRAEGNNGTYSLTIEVYRVS